MGGGWRLGGGGAGFCDHAAASSAVLLRSWVDGVRDGVLLVLASLCCAQRQVPTVLFLVSLSWVRNALALWRLVKEFHIFSACCSRSSPGTWTLFLEPLVLAATCPCVLRQSTETFGRISSIFYVKSGPGFPCSSHWEIWNYFYEQYLAVSACVNLRCFGKNFTYFLRVGCPGFPAQFALDIISFCSHMAV